MSKKIHFNSFDLQTVDKSTLPHMVYNLDGTEYYVKTKKAETSDKVKGNGILKFGDYEWLIKNSWAKLLPADCTYYMKNNYTSTCQTMTVLPEELDSSNVTNMNSMFIGCDKLTTIPQLNTSKVTTMCYMFYNCTNLTTIPQLDTSKVNDMCYMFYGCTNLTAIPQLDTSKALDMRYMFQGCTSLPSVFPWTIDCTSITSINLINGIVDGSSVKEVTFKNVNASIKSKFTAYNLGSQLTKINFV